jgi:Rieske Fe-S protein
MTERHYDRRTVLGVGGAGVVGLGFLTLAGCSARPSETTGDAAATTADPATATAPSTGTSPSTGSSTAASSSGASGGPSLAALSDVPVGGCAAASAKVGGNPVVISQQTAGKVAAFSAICTHMGCTVNPAGAEFHCPCHGSRYNAFTGEVLQGPAPSPLPAIAVKVVGNEIVAG